jgi:hypothetical protein
MAKVTSFLRSAVTSAALFFSGWTILRREWSAVDLVVAVLFGVGFTLGNAIQDWGRGRIAEPVREGLQKER